MPDKLPLKDQTGYIIKNRTVFFDWLVFWISLSLGFIYPSMTKFAASPEYSYWMFSALLLYTVGATLKHLPLYYRLISTGKSPREIPYLLFLVLGHWIIISTALIFAEPVIGIIIIKTSGKNNVDGRLFIINMLVAGFITWLVFRHKKTIKPSERHTPGFLFRRELIGDIFLVSGVSILSFIFWEQGIMAMLTARPAASISDVWFLFIILGITFVLFYLPLRYLFLAEDHSNQQTWKRMLLIFGLILIRSLFVWLK